MKYPSNDFITMDAALRETCSGEGTTRPAIKPCHPNNKTENKSREINAFKKGESINIDVMFS